MESKYKKPLYVIAWEIHPSMPRCCWLCQFFDQKTAYCSQFKQVVPEDFANKEDACNAWLDKDGIPF